MANVKIDDVMVQRPMFTTPGRSVGHVRGVMLRHHIGCMPVLDPQGEPIGIVTLNDLVDAKDGARISQVMTKDVFVVPQYGDPSLAARIMRNHHIHHVVVTHERKVVGIISSFDLLQLVEEHRFVAKTAPDTPRDGISPRKKLEQA